mgnify:CR=1 FL=1
MSQKPVTQRAAAEKAVKAIRRATRKQHSVEEKIRIVLSGLRGEDSIAELCRKEGIAQNLYYRWSKEFLEAGKKRLAGDTAREAVLDEILEPLRRLALGRARGDDMRKLEHDRRAGARAVGAAGGARVAASREDDSREQSQRK